MRIFSIILLSLFALHVSNAQELTREEMESRAVQAIKDLEEGVLVLRLPSNAKKIKAMQDMLSSDISQKDKDRIKKQVNSIKEQTRQENQAYAKAFAENFNFAPVYIIYDTSTTALLSGAAGEYLLNTDMEPVSSSKIAGKPILIARLGRTNRSNTSGAEAIILMDTNLDDLTNPFPYAARINSLGYAFNRLLIPDEEAFAKRLTKVVSKLDRNLQRFNIKVAD